MNPNYYQQCPPRSFPYTIQMGDSYYSLAVRFNTTIPALVSANPLINPNNLRIGQTICVPSQQIYPSCPEGNYYTIKPGDTLYGIATAYNVSIDDLIEANPGIDPNMIRVAQIICIPLATPPVSCPEGNSYTIQRGDTFYRIARRYNVSLDDLLEANPGINPDRLLIGQIICIPLAVPPVTCPENAVPYIIKQGDTFAKLAENFNTTIDIIRSLNPTVNPNVLLIGQRICLPESN